MNIVLSHDHQFASPSPGINAAFGQRLRFLRDQHGVSLTELALRLGLTCTEMKAMEAGSFEPDLVLLSSISRALRLSLPELLRGL